MATAFSFYVIIFVFGVLVSELVRVRMRKRLAVEMKRKTNGGSRHLPPLSVPINGNFLCLMRKCRLTITLIHKSMHEIKNPQDKTRLRKWEFR